ncbi:hypothetical protein SAMN04488116_1074 [Flagellimonas flava]|uniref:Uncharacterized protein n=1 Tax=Flagellimonas flava TaxID=570519 RepID=A0A1M5J1Y7_9FLAO|nr:hypothetical protein SAMN04488116_1074 [Allomuricauda flava]
MGSAYRVLRCVLPFFVISNLALNQKGVFKCPSKLKRRFQNKIKSIRKDLWSIVVKVSNSVVKVLVVYAKVIFVGVLCISWSSHAFQNKKGPANLDKTLLREHYMKMKKLLF